MNSDGTTEHRARRPMRPKNQTRTLRRLAIRDISIYLGEEQARLATDDVLRVLAEPDHEMIMAGYEELILHYGKPKAAQDAPALRALVRVIWQSMLNRVRL